MTRPIAGTVTILLVVAGVHAADGSKYPNSKLLIEPAELSKPEARARFRLLDVRSQDKYSAGHIPGAVAVDAADWSKAFNTEQSADSWAQRIGRFGVDADSPVVVYGEAETPEAARIWWILRYWGIKDVRLLNGGWQAWEKEGGGVSTEPAQVPPARPRLAPEKYRMATMQQVLDSLDRHSLQIIDARSAGEYCGEQGAAKRKGAIPGAVHLEWKELLDPTTHRFKSADALAKLFQDRKIDLERPTVTHCQSGGRAAVMAFALELMGAKEVTNYYKSWAEWGNDEHAPIIKPKK
jgi:thiosulfate/3-mercaptopyruvate sulfurtransferase